uniref:PNPLA domain-containing protein n=1 Tax=Gopherus evgoodei TaxID=1825980 RepID=A0A8C4VKD3_9SAUR
MAEADRNGTGTPFSLSFSGSGFLALYQIGVVQSLLELAPEILKSASKVYGASAGSLIAALLCHMLGISAQTFITALNSWVALVKTILGPLSPGCNMLCTIQKRLYKMLPENSHQVASGRLHISLTRVMDGQNVMVSEFSSKEDLIQALICSCFVPIYCGFIPPSFRGVRYVDGGFTNLQPCSDLEAVITVSPFTGELDICPRDCPAIFYSFQIFNSSIQISVENLCRISYALFPPSYLVSGPYQCAPVLLNGLGYTCELQCNKGAPGALAHSPFTLASEREAAEEGGREVCCCLNLQDIMLTHSQRPPAPEPTLSPSTYTQPGPALGSAGPNSNSFDRAPAGMTIKKKIM